MIPSKLQQLSVALQELREKRGFLNGTMMLSESLKALKEIRASQGRPLTWECIKEVIIEAETLAMKTTLESLERAQQLCRLSPG